MTSSSRAWAALAVAVLAGLLTPGVSAAADTWLRAGTRLYVEPPINVLRAGPRGPVVTTTPGVRRVARTPQAIWLGSWTSSPRDTVAQALRQARRQRAYPTFVLYALPARGCADGPASAWSEYARFVRVVVDALEGSRALVVLEPDALARLDCLSAVARRRTLQHLRAAVGQFARRRAVMTYIDAGHSGWIPAKLMATRLRSVHVGKVRGFSLNVANHRWTTGEVTYGREMSSRLGGRAHFVVDTSRNGSGPHPEARWCNAPGRTLGAAPRIVAQESFDAMLWIKRPLEGDGRCRRS